MARFQPMTDFYIACGGAGLNVAALSGWNDHQPGYYFYRNGFSTGTVSSPPQTFYFHHTASAAYTPNISANGKSKANIYLGLARPGTARLYSTGSGAARAVFCVGGAANYGNGAMDKDMWNRYVSKDLVVPGPMRSWGGKDNGYANRLGIGMEIVHKGDGSPLAPDVFELACRLGAVAEQVFGWKKNQSHLVGHEDSTTRKIDPKFAQGSPYTMGAIRARVAAIHGGTAPPIDSPQEDDVPWLPIKSGWGMGEESEWRSVVAFMQRLLNAQPAVDPKVKTDGQYGSKTETALIQVFGGTGKQVTGNQMARLVVRR
jgi:hypothetical protein